MQGLPRRHSGRPGRRELIRFAKGEKNLERFCDRLLDGSGGSGGGGDDDDDGQSGPGDGDGGSLPPVSFHPVPRSGVAPEPGAGADTEVPPLPKSTGAASVLTR